MFVKKSLILLVFICFLFPLDIFGQSNNGFFIIKFARTRCLESWYFDFLLNFGNTDIKAIKDKYFTTENAIGRKEALAVGEMNQKEFNCLLSSMNKVVKYPLMDITDTTSKFYVDFILGIENQESINIRTIGEVNSIIFLDRLILSLQNDDSSNSLIGLFKSYQDDINYRIVRNCR